MSVLLGLLKWRLHSRFFPPSLHFLPHSRVLFKFISKCVSAAVLTPACSQGQTRKETGFGGQPENKKHTLMERWAA